MEPLQILSIVLFALFFVLAIFPPGLSFGLRVLALLGVAVVGVVLGKLPATEWTATVPSPLGDLGGVLWGAIGFILSMILATIVHFVRKKKAAA